jgi:hypothetical protein
MEIITPSPKEGSQSWDAHTHLALMDKVTHYEDPDQFRTDTTRSLPPEYRYKQPHQLTGES